jgi:hypothetical protein
MHTGVNESFRGLVSNLMNHKRLYSSLTALLYLATSLAMAAKPFIVHRSAFQALNSLFAFPNAIYIVCQNVRNST